MYTSTLLQYAREQLLERSFISNDSDISTSSSISSDSCNSFRDNRHPRRDSLDELISNTDAPESLPSSPRSVPYHLHEDRDDHDDTIDHSQIHSRADLRDVIIRGGVDTTEL